MTSSVFFSALTSRLVNFECQSAVFEEFKGMPEFRMFLYHKKKHGFWSSHDFAGPFFYRDLIMDISLKTSKNYLPASTGTSASKASASKTTEATSAFKTSATAKSSRSARETSPASAMRSSCLARKPKQCPKRRA